MPLAITLVPFPVGQVRATAVPTGLALVERGFVTRNPDIPKRPVPTGLAPVGTHSRGDGPLGTNRASTGASPVGGHSWGDGALGTSLRPTGTSPVGTTPGAKPVN